MNQLKCNFCSGNHSCRKCPIEKELAPYIKKMIGNKIEQFIGQFIGCPHCGKHNLKVLGNNSPSLDIICTVCKKNYEVKRENDIYLYRFIRNFTILLQSEFDPRHSECEIKYQRAVKITERIVTLGCSDKDDLPYFVA